MLIGTPSIYYGDEMGIKGGIAGDEGYRYPMPWQKMPWNESSVFQLYQKLAHLKTERKALSAGGMKFLYAEGKILALARFYEEDILVAVMSAEDKAREIRLPLGSVGAVCPKGDADIFGKKLNYRKMDDVSISLVVDAHQGYCIDCCVKMLKN